MVPNKICDACCKEIQFVISPHFVAVLTPTFWQTTIPVPLLFSGRVERYWGAGSGRVLLSILSPSSPFFRAPHIRGPRSPQGQVPGSQFLPLVAPAGVPGIIGGDLQHRLFANKKFLNDVSCDNMGPRKFSGPEARCPAQYSTSHTETHTHTGNGKQWAWFGGTPAMARKHGKDTQAPKPSGRLRSRTLCLQGSAQKQDVAEPLCRPPNLTLSVHGVREGPAPRAQVSSSLWALPCPSPRHTNRLGSSCAEGAEANLCTVRVGRATCSSDGCQARRAVP